jgi:phosphate-selective porin OprO/OprP
MASYRVTGETRPRRGGVVTRVKPKSGFDGKGGTAALELAARDSALDLADGGLDGGWGHDVTLGVNGHLDPGARLMVDRVRYTRHGVGVLDAVVLRLQVDFQDPADGG